MTHFTTNIPYSLACLYYERVIKEFPEPVSDDIINSKMSELIVKDLEKFNRQEEIRKERKVFKDNEYERL